MRRLTKSCSQQQGSTTIAPQQHSQQQSVSPSHCYTAVAGFHSLGHGMVSHRVPPLTLVRSDTAVKLRSGVDLHFPRHRARDARRSGSVHFPICPIPGSRHMMIVMGPHAPSPGVRSEGLHYLDLRVCRSIVGILAVVVYTVEHSTCVRNGFLQAGRRAKRNKSTRRTATAQQ